MEIPNSFVQTLGKLESQMKKLNIALANTKLMYDCGSMELAYEVAMQMEIVAERTVMLTRALPAYMGNPLAADEIETIIEASIPVAMGFTHNGWFSVRIPLLLPKKEEGSADYIRSFLYPAMKRFFRDKEPVRYHDCVLIYRHVYSRHRPERQFRDHDSIESNMVSDIVALYVMEDDSPSVCCHYECSAAANFERTEVYVVPQQDFPVWLEMEKTMPDEGVMLYDNRL